MSQEKINTDGLIVQGIGKAYKNKTILHDVDLEPVSYTHLTLPTKA